MNGNNFLVDTNISLYLLSGDDTLAELLDGKDFYVSFITELELLGYKNISAEEQEKIRTFLSDCIVIDINSGIKEYAINLRRSHTIKLPDAIIAGTALYLGLPLITSDMGFKKIEDLNILLYEQ